MSNYAQFSAQHPLIIILLGPPGCGKGTQSKQLMKTYQLPQISTGDLFRQHMSEQTSIGREAKEYMQAGHLVPDHIVLAMLFDRIQQPDCIQGYLLDGFPRTINQANALFAQVNPVAKVLALCLQVPDEVIISRTLSRLVCRDCGAIYNSEKSPPKIANQCDACGGEVYRRNDDQEEIIRERLTVYHAQTQPLIEYYANKGFLQVFDGEESSEKVYAALCEYIQSQTN